MERNKKKRILIPIFDAMVASNTVRTQLLGLLTEQDIEIVIIPQRGMQTQYEREFKNINNVYIGSHDFWKRNRAREIISELYTNSIHTIFMKGRQKLRFYDKKKYMRYCFVGLLRNLGKIILWRKFLQRIEILLPVPQNIREECRKWNPDVVFCPTMISWQEYALITWAKRHNKIAIGMVKSWDNLTTKIFLRNFPDKLIVLQESQIKEAIDLWFYPKDRIIVSGYPKYDNYFKENYIDSKEIFFKELGLNLEKKIILYAPAGDWMSMHDKDVLKHLLDAINEEKIKNVQVLLRLHPAYESKTEELRGTQNLVVERPGTTLTRSGEHKIHFEFGESDRRRLANEIYHSDILINTGSSMSIDAAVYDKPIILINYDGNAKNLPYQQTVKRHHDLDHYKPIINSGGVWLVNSKDELVQSINSYLENPNIKKEGRATIRKEQCYKLDGGASRRIVNEVLNGVNLVNLYK